MCNLRETSKVLREGVDTFFLHVKKLAVVADSYSDEVNHNDLINSGYRVAYVQEREFSYKKKLHSIIHLFPNVNYLILILRGEKFFTSHPFLTSMLRIWDLKKIYAPYLGTDHFSKFILNHWSNKCQPNIIVIGCHAYDFHGKSDIMMESYCDFNINICRSMKQCNAGKHTDIKEVIAKYLS